MLRNSRKFLKTKWLPKRHTILVIGKHLYFFTLLKNPASKRHQYLFENRKKPYLAEAHLKCIPDVFLSQWNNRTWPFSSFRKACTYSFMHMFVSKQMRSITFTNIPSSFLTHLFPPWQIGTNRISKDLHCYDSCVDALKLLLYS